MVTASTPTGVTVIWRDRQSRCCFGRLFKVGHKYAHIDRGQQIVRVKREQVEIWPPSERGEV